MRPALALTCINLAKLRVLDQIPRANVGQTRATYRRSRITAVIFDHAVGQGGGEIMGTIILIVLVILLLGGGGFGYSRYGYGGGIGIGGLLLLILILYLVFGHGRF
jgi:hypothetical protein